MADDIGGGRFAFLNKKVGGVPVVYIGLVFVVILAFVAWKMNPKPTGAEDATDPEADTGEADLDAAYGYEGFTANPAPAYAPAPDAGDTTSTVDNNDAWKRRAVDWLVTSKLAGGGVALVAMNKFLAGEQLTYSEGQLRDAAIAHFGSPPEGVDAGGTGAKTPDAAKRQFTKFPGRHVVKGPNDNTYAELAQLYYHSAVPENIALIKAANARLGASITNIPVGASVGIPAWREAKYYLTPKGVDTAQEIAAKNGTTGGAIVHLNPTMKFPVKTNTRVRVL